MSLYNIQILIKGIHEFWRRKSDQNFLFARRICSRLHAVLSKILIYKACPLLLWLRSETRLWSNYPHFCGKSLRQQIVSNWNEHKSDAVDKLLMWVDVGSIAGAVIMCFTLALSLSTSVFLCLLFSCFFFLLLFYFCLLKTTETNEENNKNQGHLFLFYVRALLFMSFRNFIKKMCYLIFFEEASHARKKIKKKGVPLACFAFDKR